MVTYILILWFVASGGLTTAEFKSLSSCTAAAEAALASLRTKDPKYPQTPNTGNYVCVRK